MFIGAYVCLNGIVYLLVLLALMLLARPQGSAHDWRKRIFNYSIVAFLLSSLGLVVFVGLTVWGVPLQLGQYGSYNLPGDYHGVAGWVALVTATFGVLSPIAAAIWINHQST